MAHYAEIDENNIVLRVIVAKEDFINKIEGNWLQTSYNTYQGKHINGGTPLRMNFASIGGYYDKEKDAFIPKKTFDSWILDDTICDWIAPKSIPELSENELCYWDEKTKDWIIEQIINNFN